MKTLKSLLLPALLIFSFTMSNDVLAQSQSDRGKTGIGVVIGEPTGLSMKFWQNSRNAFDLGAAWSLSGNDAISIHGDYLWHSWLDADQGDLALYYGIGARAWFTENNSAAGARIPLGINYLFEDSPVGLFVEIAPVIDFVPDTEADGSGGFGVRFYF